MRVDTRGCACGWLGGAHNEIHLVREEALKSLSVGVYFSSFAISCFVAHFV